MSRIRDKRLTVVINGVSARTGGGLTYLRKLLPPLAKQLSSRDARLHLLVNPAVKADLAADLVSPNIALHAPAWASLPGAQRLLCEQVLLPALLGRLDASVVLHTGDTLPLLSTCPAVLLSRNMLLYAPLGKNSARLRILRLLARASMKRASAVAFVSQALADQIPSKGGSTTWRVIHHGPGLEPSGAARQFTIDDLSIIVVSTLYDYKRIEIAIDALAELRHQWPDASLTVMGRPVETNYVSTLQRRTRELGLDDAVRFQGEATARSVEEAYQHATVAYVTTRNESFCHPILEAFSAKIPVVVATDLSVAAEIADQAAVYSAPSGRSFAEATARLFRHPSYYQEVVIAGVEQVGHFSWEKAAEQTARLLLEIADIP